MMRSCKKKLVLAVLIHLLVATRGAGAGGVGGAPAPFRPIANLPWSMEKHGQEEEEERRRRRHHLRGGGGAGVSHHHRALGTSTNPYPFVQEIFPRLVGVGDQFGLGVAIDGNYMVVGAWYDDVYAPGDNIGSAYIFEKDAATGLWVERDQIYPPQADGVSRFAYSVDISNHTVVVGALYHKLAYVYERNPKTGKWDQKSKLTASDWGLLPGWGQYFGRKVAIDGDTIAVGAMEDYEIHDSSGAIYMYEKPEGGWPLLMNETQKVKGLDPYKWERISENGLEIEGDTMVAGARLANTLPNGAGVYCGSAYVFKKGSSGLWEQQVELFPPDPTAGQDKFGWDVGISGDVLVAGAYKHDLPFSNHGAAYIFVRNESAPGGWTFAEKLSKPSPKVSDEFGYGVAIEGDLVVVGAIGADENGAESGGAYAYHWNPCSNTWPFVAKLIPPYTDRQSGDWLGWEISISGEVVAVSPRHADPQNENGTIVSSGGATYIFNRMNQPPSIVGVGVDDGHYPGEEATISVRFEDSDVAAGYDTLSVQVDWGDGTYTEHFFLCNITSAGLSVVLAHEYGWVDDFAVRITATDMLGEMDSWVETISVVSPNHPPAIIIIRTEVEYDVTEDVVIQVQCQDVDVSAGDDALKASVDWGDGHTDSGLPPDSPDEPLEFSLSHKYDSAGNFEVNITVTDSHDESDSRTVTVSVFSNVPPVIHSVGYPAPQSFEKSVSFDVVWSDDDLPDDTITCRVDYGDGSAEEFEPDSSGYLTIVHSYSDAGVYPIEVTMNDLRGENETHSFSIALFDRSRSVEGEGSFASPLGAHRDNSQLGGIGILEFEAKYKKREDAPYGSVNFLLKTGSDDDSGSSSDDDDDEANNTVFKFYSTHISLFVVNSEGRVWLEGNGRMKADEMKEYNFMAEAQENQIADDDDEKEPDGFGITIWHDREDPLYDVGEMIFDTTIEVEIEM